MMVSAELQFSAGGKKKKELVDTNAMGILKAFQDQGVLALGYCQPLFKTPVASGALG